MTHEDMRTWRDETMRSLAETEIKCINLLHNMGDPEAEIGTIEDPYLQEALSHFQAAIHSMGRFAERKYRTFCGMGEYAGSA